MTITLFWQYQQASGIREFTDLATATDWTDAQLTNCPQMTIIRES